MSGFKTLKKVIIFSFVGLRFATASDVISIGSTNGDFKYSVSAPDEVAAKTFLSLVSFRFADQGFFSVWSRLKPNATPALADSSLDGLFLDTNVTSGVLVRLGMTPQDSNLKNKILRWGDDYLYHGTTKGGLSYAFLFRGVEKDNVIRTVNAVTSETSAHAVNSTKGFKVDKIYDLLWVPSAHAAAAAAAAESCTPPNVTGGQPDALISSGVDVTANSIISHPGKASIGCVVGAIHGVWDSTGGLVWGAAKLAWKVVSKPVQTAHEAWDGAKQAYAVAQALWHDLYGELKKAVKAFDRLDAETKGKMICELVSMIGTGVVISYISAGVLFPAQMAKVTAAINDLVKLPAFVKALGAAEKVSARIAAITPEAFKVALATVKKAIFKTSAATPEKEALVVTAAEHGLAGSAVNDPTQIKQLIDAIDLLEATEEGRKRATELASSIIANLNKKDLSPEEITKIAKAALAAADYGIPDPKQFANILNTWPDGVNGVSNTLEIAAELERKPQYMKIKHIEERKIAAYNDALDWERKTNPHLAKISDKEWPEKRNKMRKCVLGL